MRKNWIRAGLLTTLVLCAALMPAGCKKPAEQAAAGGGPTTRKILIGIIGKSLSNMVFLAAQKGAQDAAVDLGKKYGVDVQIEIRTPTDESAQKQADAIEYLTREGADGITVSCSNAQTLIIPINEAADKGIPVMCFDSDSPDSKRFCCYGADDHVAGTRVMQELAIAMGDKGTIAILAGNQSAPNLQKRAAAVREELAKHPNMHELNGPGKGTFYHQETAEKAVEALTNAQRANPDIQGWALVGGWPLFTTNALPWPPGSIKVVSLDALPQELPYLKDGHVEVLIGQDCYSWGYKSVEVLLDKIINKKDPPAVNIYDPLTRVTKDNADEVAKMWEKWQKP